MLVATLGFRLGERRCPQICDRPRIFAKLALRDRAAAIVYVSDRGIVTPRYRS